MDNESKEIISQASALVTLLQFVASAFVGVLSYFCHFSMHSSIIITVLCFLGMFVCLMFFSNFKKKVSIFCLEGWKYFRARKGKKEYRNKVIEYTYESEEEMSIRVSYGVRFNKGSYESIDERLKWTAGKVEKIESIYPEQHIKMVDDSEKNDLLTYLGHQYFEIKLPKTYTVQDGFIQSGFASYGLRDDNHIAKTCLIAGIYDKLYCLTLRVRFSTSLKVKNIRKIKYADFLDEEPYSTEEGKIDVEEGGNYRFVEFKIKRPILGGKYAIDWDFAN